MELVLVFENTHHAIMGERLLLDNGIKVKVMPLPSAIKSGCGICLRVLEGEYKKAMQIFGKSKVKVSEVYLKREINGKNQHETYEKRQFL